MAPRPLQAVPTLAGTIPPPTWGEEFARLRKSRYGNADALVADLRVIGVSTTTATISRLENSTQKPDVASRLVVATATAVLCDTHPSKLGLTLDVLPLGVYGALFGAPNDPSAIGESSSACTRSLLRLVAC